MFLLQCYGNSGNSCCFSVGSCYNINSGFASFGNSFWKHLWQNIHERLKRFLWRLAAIIIPTKDVLVKRLEELDQMCNLCDRETKTLFHFFLGMFRRTFTSFLQQMGFKLEELNVSNIQELVRGCMNLILFSDLQGDNKEFFIIFW